MIRFEREALYADVWDIPLTKLGKKFGLSDNGLRKICKAMNIPLPKAGHWAKIAAGHNVPKTPLSKNAERTTYVCHPPTQDVITPELNDDRRWCLEQEEQERQPVMNVVVDPEPTRWHPALAPTRKRLAEAAHEYEGYRAAIDKQAGKPEARWPESAKTASWRWQFFAQRGQLLIDTQKIMPIRVSLETYQRALVVFNTILFEAGKRGFKVSLGEKDGKIRLDGHDASLSIRISERMLAQMKTVPKLYGTGETQARVRTPSGILRVYVEGQGGGGEVSDETDRPLETRINDVFVKIYRAVVSCREWARQRAVQERQWAEEKIHREAEENRRQEEERRLAAENLRRLNLAYESSAWQLASQVRSYVAAVISSSGDSASGELLAWRDWALKTAEEIDPVLRRIDGKQISYASKDEANTPALNMFDQSPSQIKSGPDYWMRQAIFNERRHKNGAPEIK
jgi:hypothetical protein